MPGGETTMQIIALASGVAALAYGLVLVTRPHSLLRMVVKTAAVGLLAVLAYVLGGPWLLVAALAFSALGDAFMSDPDRWLTPGLGAFLLAHILYIPLFLQHGDVAGWTEPVRLIGVVAVVLAALAMLRWLWPGLGTMKVPVIAYVLAILGMVGTSFLLPAALWPAMLGAAMFMASDAILAGELFRKSKLFGSERVTAWAVWFLYYGGQALIAYALLASCCSRQVM